MIPVGAIVATIVVARALYLRAKTPTGHTPRRPFRGRSGWFALAWLVAWPTWLMFLLVVWRRPDEVVADVFAVLFALVCVPWPIVRRVLVPCGLPRLSWAVAHLADWTFGLDRSGGAALAAVLAAVRSGRTADIAWARARVERIELLGAAGVVAAALLAEHDGDRATRDRFLRAVDAFDPRVVPRLARQIVAEQQALTHLAAHAFDDVLAVDGHRSRLVLFLQAYARRMKASAPPSTGERVRLGAAWLVAPRRRRTRLLLWRALAGPWGSPASMMPAAVDANAAMSSSTIVLSEEPLQRALALHVRLAQHVQATTTEGLCELAAAWTSAVAAHAPAWSARARALGVRDDGVVGRGVEDVVVDALVALVEPLDLHEADLSALPGLLVLAIERVRTARLDALEIAALAIRQRVPQDPGEGQDLTPVGELREWLAVRDLYEAVARTGRDGRMLAWEASHWTLCEIAVRLWNVRAEHRLANAMFRWLLAEATALGDLRGIETQQANVRCGP